MRSCPNDERPNVAVEDIVHLKVRIYSLVIPPADSISPLIQSVHTLESQLCSCWHLHETIAVVCVLLCNILHVRLNCDCTFKCFAMMQWVSLPFLGSWSFPCCLYDGVSRNWFDPLVANLGHLTISFIASQSTLQFWPVHQFKMQLTVGKHCITQLARESCIVESVAALLLLWLQPMTITLLPVGPHDWSHPVDSSGGPHWEDLVLWVLC